MKRVYVSLTGEKIDLARITVEEKKELGRILKAYQAGEAYPNFVNRVSVPGSRILRGKRWITQEVAASPLYRVCQDLADRLGIAQGYLALGENSSEEGTGFLPQGDAEYVSSEEAAKFLGVTPEAVRKAARNKRLAAAKKIGRTYLFEWKVIQAYAERTGRKVRAR